MIDLIPHDGLGGWAIDQMFAFETIGVLLLELVGGLLGIEGLGAGLTIFGIGVSASTVGQIALALIFLGLSLVFRPKLPSPEDGHQATRQEIPSRIWVAGVARVGGAYVCYESYQETSHDVVLLNDAKIGGFREYFLHEDRVLRHPVTGYVTSAPDHTDERYQLHVIINRRYGEATETAYADLVAELPTIWTTDHRGDGTASLHLKCLGASQDGMTTAYPNLLPIPSAVIEGAAIWDPRDSNQDPDDPATWVDYAEWSDATTYGEGDRVLYSPDPDGPGCVYISRGALNLNFNPVDRPDKWISVNQNPILQVIYFVTSQRHGLGLEREVLIDPVVDALMVRADYCDELVELASLDYQPRYVSNGWFVLDTDPSEVIQAILATCDGWMTENGEGGLVLEVGKYVAPSSRALKAQHIVAMMPQYGVEDEKVVNDLKIRFTSPTHKYKEAPGQAWRNEADITERGVRRSQPLNLPWVHYHPQARRLAKRLDARLNAPIRGKFVARDYGLAFLGKRWIRLQHADFDGLEDVVVEITKATVDLMAGKVTFDFLLTNPNEIDAWDAATEEGTPPPNPDDASDESLPVPVDVGIVLVGDLSAGYMAEVSFDDPLRPALSYVLRYRLSDVGGEPGAWLEIPVNEFTTDGDRIRMTTATLPIDQEFVFQVASVGAKGGRSEWSAAVEWTATAASLDFSLAQNSGYVAILEDI